MLNPRTQAATALHLELPPLDADDATPSAPLEVARNAILNPSGLDEGQVAGVLGTVMGHSVDYADLYFQVSREESWSLEDGIVKDGAHSIEQGVGVRALAGDKTGFAYSDEILLPALTEASRAARAIARSGTGASLQAWRASVGHRLYLPDDPLETISDAEKVKLLERVDAAARRMDPRVKQVMASLSGSHEVVLVMASDGTLAADVRPLVRMNVSVIVEQNGRREQGYCGGGGRYSVARFLKDERWMDLVREAVRSALVNLEAVPAPAGTMTVVLGPGWPGVLLHASRAISIARAPRRSPIASVNGSPPSNAPSWTTAPSARAAARSTSTTRARPRNARPSSRTVCCAATCRTSSTRGSWASPLPATDDASHSPRSRCRA